VDFGRLGDCRKFVHDYRNSIVFRQPTAVWSSSCLASPSTFVATCVSWRSGDLVLDAVFEMIQGSLTPGFMSVAGPADDGAVRGVIVISLCCFFVFRRREYLVSNLSPRILRILASQLHLFTDAEYFVLPAGVFHVH